MRHEQALVRCLFQRIDGATFQVSAMWPQQECRDVEVRMEHLLLIETKYVYNGKNGRNGKWNKGIKDGSIHNPYTHTWADSRDSQRKGGRWGVSL